MSIRSTAENPRDCHCLALRLAARAVSRMYDDALAPAGLRATQFTMLATLHRKGPLTIKALAEQLHLDRTTAGKNIRPLTRSKFVRITPSATDARRREATLTATGRSALQAARPLWSKAQRQYETRHGKDHVQRLRQILLELALDP